MAKNTETKRIILLDAQAILHRAYHALPDFSSQKGEPTGALYGLSLMLLKIIDELTPDYIVACFDVKEPTYRHEAYSEYKAKRKKTDEELIYQIEKSKTVFAAFGIPVYEKPGFEADDLLGTIVEQLKDKKDLEIIIASGDMDTLQLVEKDRVKVYTLKKGIKDTVIYNEKSVTERFGFSPTFLPDYKGLRGDPSDNIIGVKGIGEKTATDLIKHFGTIEDIYKTIKKDETLLEEKGIKPRIVEILRAGEEEALFSKMLGTIRRDAPITFSLPKEEWSLDNNREHIVTLFEELEFKSLRDRVKNDAKQAPETLSFGNLEVSIDPQELKETALACWLLDSNITDPTVDDILRVGEAKTFPEAKQKIFSLLEERNMKQLFLDIEKPLISVTEKMEHRGVKIDASFLKKLSHEYHEQLTSLEKQIWKMAGQEFNLNSPKQLSKVLFEDMRLASKRIKKTGGGAISTRESELLKLKELHPVIALIIDYRELQKLLSTYIDNLPLMLTDSRLHAHFRQTGTTTGRMSSENPNLQNIPIKTDLGKRIREGFIAEEGFVLASFDYSQIDLRSAAFLSKDVKLIDIFKAGGDVHQSVASVVFNVPAEKVDYEMRRRAKVINFGIMYGMGVNALRANLGTSRDEAEKFLEDYFKNFSTLAHYLEKVKKEAEKKGYTETFFGRRRYFPALRSTIPYIKSAAERMAINAPIQGTSADIIKLAMVKVEEYIEKEHFENKIFLVLQIHDELIYEMRKEDGEAVVAKIKSVMEGVIDQEKISGVPLAVNVKVGKRWGEME